MVPKVFGTHRSFDSRVIPAIFFILAFQSERQYRFVQKLLQMKRLILIPLVLITLVVNGQDQPQDHVGNWIMYFGNHKLSEKYSIHNEAQLRLYEPFSNFNQGFVRLGLNYHINAHSLATVGYGFFRTESFPKGDSKVFSNEHRIWEQFILRNAIGRVGFEHRYRLEQRWISFSDGSDDYKNRIRYRIYLSVPITKKKMEDNTLYFAFYDEIFLDLSSAPFDQNRLYGAVGYKLNNALNFQIGYLRHRLGSIPLDRLQFSVFLNTGLGKSE